MLRIQLDSQQAEAQIKRIASQVQHPKKLYGVLGEALIRLHQKRFDKQESPTGEKWKPLVGWYKASKGSHTKILRHSGQFRNTLTYNHSDHGLEFGSPVKYARLHQFGGTITPKKKKVLKLGQLGYARRVNVPARPWLGLNTKEEAFLLQKTMRFLEQTVRAR